MEKQCAAVRVDGEGQGIRISLSGAVCQSTGPGSGGGTVGNHDALEQRTVRRTHKPAEGDQAPDLRKGEVRTSQSPCVALEGLPPHWGLHRDCVRSPELRGISSSNSGPGCEIAPLPPDAWLPHSEPDPNPQPCARPAACGREREPINSSAE